MAQERNYKIGKSLILDGTIKTFMDIFEYVPKTNFADDMPMHHNTITSRIEQPETFTIQELTKIADLLDIDPMVIITLAFTQYNHERKGKKKK